MSNLTLPSGTGDARFMAFLKALRDKFFELENKQSGTGGLEARIAAIETANASLIARVTALEAPKV